MSHFEDVRPVIFGEALFDVFGPDQRSLGGAPFNVAWNLRLLGANPLFISRVGDDELGREVLASMAEIELFTGAVQIDKIHHTGVVKVQMHGADHTFDILANQAYDYIDGQKALEVIEDYKGDMLYHGTLATRADVSSNALTTVKGSSGLPIFVDANLRAPWSDGRLAREALKGARWAKLNDEELFEVLGSCRVSGDELEAVTDYFRTDSGIDLLVVTMGDQGAMFAGPGGTMRGSSPAVADFVDSVGAGDAFTSVTMLGLAKSWDHATILDRATSFASSVCGIRGATTIDKSFYDKQVSIWV